MIIEEIVKKHLESKLSVPVKVKKEIGCKSYVLIEKTGGSREDMLNSAILTAQSYGVNLLSAAELNEKVKEAMQSLTDNDMVSKCELNSDYHYPDPDIKEERYQAVFQIRHY